jgi:hypothetical protein
VPRGAAGFSGPMVCAIAPPSGFVLSMAVGTRRPNGRRLASASPCRVILVRCWKPANSCLGFYANRL